jgi:phosphate transport system substrate-binding protein
MSKMSGIALLRLMAIAVLPLFMIACSADDRDGTADVIISGSSTVFPIMQHGASLFMNNHPNMQVANEFIGTTAGFRRFCDGETDINAASRGIDDSESERCRLNGIHYIRLDVATDALAIVTHPANQWLESVTMDQLRAIWAADAEGTLTQWDQVDPSWPNRSMNLYGRGADSGTYDFFTTQLGGLRQSRLDYIASENEDELAMSIAADRNALGFFGLGAYHRHWAELRLVGVDQGDSVIFPDIETVRSGRYQPFTRPLYMYVRVKAPDSVETINMASLRFAQHFYTHLSSWLHFTGFLPLEDSVYEQIRIQLSDE